MEAFAIVLVSGDEILNQDTVNKEEVGTGGDFLLSSINIKCISFFSFCLLLNLHSTHPSLEKALFKDLNYDEFTYDTKSRLGSSVNEPDTERIDELRAMT